MNIYPDTTARPDSRRFETTPTARPDGPTDARDSNNTLSCVEHHDLFEQVRAMVYQRFQPACPFEQYLADEVVEDMWLKQRFNALANHTFSFKIEEDWDKLSSKYPNADAAFRSVRAWQDLQSSPGMFRAYDLQDRLWRRRKHDTRELALATRER